MPDRDIYWTAFFPTAFLLAISALALEMSGFWPWRSLRPDLVWCLAFYAAWRVPALSSLMAFFAAGFVRDVFLGPKMGAATLAYLLAALLIAQLRGFAVGGDPMEQFVLAGIAAVATALLKMFFDFGWSFAAQWGSLSALALGNGLLTVLVYPAMVLILGLPIFRPWRERRWLY